MQYEGTLVDGRSFYFRYRWGYACLKVGNVEHEVVNDPGVSVEVGAELDGWMDKAQYEKTLIDLYHLHNSKYDDTIITED